MTDTTPVEDVTADPLLQVLAMLAQENGLSMGLTLNLSGQLMDGMLVSRDAWIERLGEMARNSPSEGASGLTDGIAAAWRDSDLRRSEDDPVEYGYLHLLDVEVPGGHLNGHDGKAWRVRISDVSGWSMQSRTRSQ